MSIDLVLAELDAFNKSNEHIIESFLKKLKLVYENIGEKHPQKKNLEICIDYTENGEKNGVTMDDFSSASNALKKAGLIKDDAGEQLWREIQERETGKKITGEIRDFSGKVDTITKK